MDVKLDVGENITTLVEKLADHIGVTADIVFPWYVKQQIIEGGMFFIIAGTLTGVGISLLLLNYKKAEEDERVVPTVLFGCGLLLMIVVLIVTSIGASSAMEKILNPNRGALQEMVTDMSVITGK